MSSPDQDHSVTICGAGLAGSLLAILLAQRGFDVLLYERLGDLRREEIPAGRSINLALAARGIRALELAGVMSEVTPLMIEMPGRMLHDANGARTFLPYGQDASEVIYSVSRPGLNRVLLDAAERAGVKLFFHHPVRAVDFDHREVLIANERSQSQVNVPLHHVIAADGAGSVLRQALVKQLSIQNTEDLLEHGYKELTIPASNEGTHQIETHALHIWPRGRFMLIALPNTDGSFTATLFLPHHGPESFGTLNEPDAVRGFFARYFQDALALMPNIASEFASRPTGIMGTVRCERWSIDDELLLIGDAAHAITPFHGQGMNCALEDCAQFAALLSTESDWKSVFNRFEQLRRPNTNAIAEMALENYLEMRDTVRDPKFQLQKSLSLELERRFPGRFIPRYSMVMFHARIPYSVAFDRGLIQSGILSELTEHATSLDEVDWSRAASLVEERLQPILA
ncbi:MAG TPA: NAD(P)/FAD-dependent oxidoreductase [Steroidobacteraceae bacterium]|nr:NAD(P)/FAD-dependent oxidoreductase [Steroidobacteraceae bacterium]